MHPRGAQPQGWVDALVATAESVQPSFGPVPAATAEETELILRWLEQSGVRMVRGSWHSPLLGAGRFADRYDQIALARQSLGRLDPARQDSLGRTRVQ